MDFEFDKEIDAFLRRARSSKAVFATANPQSLHLDADEIAAFAENSLPEKAKQIYTAHLANCDSCRKSLSNLILLNSENVDEIIRLPEKIVAVSPVIPWYQRIFALPNLAYTFGALIVLFGGIIGFTILRNMNNSQSLEVSQINDKPQISQQIPSESVSATPESNASANANSSANSSGEATYSSNSMMNSNTSIAASPQVMSAPAPMRNETSRENDSANANIRGESFSVDGVESEMRKSLSENNIAADNPNETKEPIKDKNSTNDTASKPQVSVTNRQIEQLPLNGRRAEDLRLSPAAKSKKTESADASENKTSTVGGKTFTRKDNVWYDANYKQQSTINVIRGTEQYKNLDKGLRTIVENLGGTVVIIWKEKAYRIQ